ncbi:uncharacterized protein LOC225852 [Mus musculus]|uniref:Predicted gene 550 n=1 Tax=Mus musculus TaxID=10090 RepID=A0A494BBN4_MOUSE|nr:uncharacterized protein LOC225852 [Mus musculus]|eukprot:XP_006531935.1 PREDICTED: uncharacterized protein Gm550 [Mus musculus]
MQPAEPQLEEPKDSGEPNIEPSSEPALDEQPEPTVTFLFTLLNTPVPIDDETTDTDIYENQFIDEDDWGPRRTSEEIELLQRDCRRLEESLYANQRENLALEEKLENLPTVVYEDLESIMIIPEESRLTQETDEDSQVKAEGHSKESKGQPASRGHSGETRGYPGGSRGYPGGSRGYPGGSPTS